MVRWLLVPAVIALLAVLGMATSSEGRDEFKAALTNNGETGPDPNDEFVSDPSGDPDADDVPPEAADDPTATPPTSVPDPAEDAAPEAGANETPPEEETGPDPELDDDQIGRQEEVSFEIQGDAGSVGVQLGAEDAALAFPRSNDGENGETTSLDGVEGDGLQRLNSGGDLEPLGSSELATGEFAVGGAPDGVDLMTADGTRIEFRATVASADSPDPADGGSEALTTDDFSITGISSDGEVETLTADENGLIDLGDGVTVQLQVEPSPPSIWEDPSTTPWRWLLLADIALVLVSLAVAYYLHRTRPLEVSVPDFVASSIGGAKQFEDFLAELLADDDPARAIRLAFETAERGMGTLPARHPIETPFEWQGRVVADQIWFAEDLNALCSRFATARFAPDRPTSADRDAAVGELRSLAVLAGYRDSSSGTSPVLIERP